MAGVPPQLPDEFWDSPAIREALAARHFGRLIRAYRTHPRHGHRALSQEMVADWLGTTQSRLSRIESGSRTEQLDLLVHWATVLKVPQQLLWFSLPDQSADLKEPADLGAQSSARSSAHAAAIARAPGPAYVPDEDAISTLREFVASAARGFLLTGSPGSGKTTLGFRLVEHLADVADVQLHVIGEWARHDRGLQTEILRYAASSRRRPEDLDRSTWNTSAHSW